MKFKPRTWKVGKHLTIKMTPEKFSLKSLLELIFWVLVMGLTVWWLL